MLGYVLTAGQSEGAVDRLLRSLAQTLTEEGRRVAGVVQMNVDRGPDLRCHMDLEVLGTDQSWRISQDLGPGAVGCRLDPHGLEQAVAHVDALLTTAQPDLVLVNKFGKQEVEGRGFRPVIARALEMGVPVVTGVGPFGHAAFTAFADGLGEELPRSEEAVLAWCRSAVRAA